MQGIWIVFSVIEHHCSRLEKHVNNMFQQHFMELETNAVGSWGSAYCLFHALTSDKGILQVQGILQMQGIYQVQLNRNSIALAWRIINSIGQKFNWKKWTVICEWTNIIDILWGQVKNYDTVGLFCKYWW